jgi:hypothetical protein
MICPCTATSRLLLKAYPCCSIGCVLGISNIVEELIPGFLTYHFYLKVCLSYSMARIMKKLKMNGIPTCHLIYHGTTTSSLDSNRKP